MGSSGLAGLGELAIWLRGLGLVALPLSGCHCDANGAFGPSVRHGRFRTVAGRRPTGLEARCGCAGQGGFGVKFGVATREGTVAGAEQASIMIGLKPSRPLRAKCDSSHQENRHCTFTFDDDIIALGQLEVIADEFGRKFSYLDLIHHTLRLHA